MGTGVSVLGVMAVVCAILALWCFYEGWNSTGTGSLALGMIGFFVMFGAFGSGLASGGIAVLGLITDAWAPEYSTGHRAGGILLGLGTAVFAVSYIRQSQWKTERDRRESTGKKSRWEWLDWFVFPGFFAGAGLMASGVLVLWAA